MGNVALRQVDTNAKATATARGKLLCPVGQCAARTQLVASGDIVTILTVVRLEKALRVCRRIANLWSLVRRKCLPFGVQLQGRGNYAQKYIVTLQHSRPKVPAWELKDNYDRT